METQPQEREKRSLGRPTLQEAGKINERLTNAGWTVLTDIGPEKFSFDEVARQAKASKKTIYARWPNKRSFLHAILDQRLHSLFENLATASRSSLAAPERYLSWLAEETFRIFTSPDGRTVERLVDWLDVTAEDDEACFARRASFDKLLEIITQFLEDNTSFSIMSVEKRDSLVHMWIDGIIGRSRTVPWLHAEELTKWSETFSRYFLMLLPDIESGVDQADHSNTNARS